jgi:predicted TIM-barrel fold metal-dependent hydrolase
VIIDVSAFTGAWPTHPVNGRLDDVNGSLAKVGVDYALYSPLDAVWCRNPHLYNGPLYRACEGRPDLLPVPFLDPTVATWKTELDEAVERGAKAIRVLPNYHGYRLDQVGAFWDAVSETLLVAIVQTRMEDPRRQHPLAVVEDVPAKEVADLGGKRPNLKLVIGGPRTAEIRSLKAELKDQPNLFADVSQADGLDAIRVLVEDGLTGSLLFGSHAPLFVPHAAVARVITEVDDAVAERILGGNAGKLFNVK